MLRPPLFAIPLVLTLLGCAGEGLHVVTQAFPDPLLGQRRFGLLPFDYPPSSGGPAEPSADDKDTLRDSYLASLRATAREWGIGVTTADGPADAPFLIRTRVTTLKPGSASSAADVRIEVAILDSKQQVVDAIEVARGDQGSSGKLQSAGAALGTDVGTYLRSRIGKLSTLETDAPVARPVAAPPPPAVAKAAPPVEAVEAPPPAPPVARPAPPPPPPPPPAPPPPARVVVEAPPPAPPPPARRIPRPPPPPPARPLAPAPPAKAPPRRVAPSAPVAAHVTKPPPRGPRRERIVDAPARGVPIASAPGFSRLDDGRTRIWVEVDQKVDVAESRAPSQLVYRLRGTAVFGATNELPLVTSFYATPVMRAQLRSVGADTELVIDLREALASTYAVVETPRGMVLWVDFPRSAIAAEQQDGPQPAPAGPLRQTLGQKPSP